MRKQPESIKPRIERLAQKFNNGERFTREEIGQELGIKPNSINSYLNYQVLNAKDYGIPQNRERVFIVGFKNNQTFNFPKKQELKLKLKDLLESNVDEKYYLSERSLKGLLNHKEKHKEKGNGFGANILDINTIVSNTLGTNQGSIERNI